MIKQFLTDVVWNELDYLIVDTPPGTSDEHISIVQYLKSAALDGAIVITTPQEVAMADVRKELNFCKKTGSFDYSCNVYISEFITTSALLTIGLNVLGVVENMADLHIPFASIMQPESGVKLVDGLGMPATIDVLER